jgi:hypothetical protein
MIPDGMIDLEFGFKPRTDNSSLARRGLPGIPSRQLLSDLEVLERPFSADGPRRFCRTSLCWVHDLPEPDQNRDRPKPWMLENDGPGVGWVRPASDVGPWWVVRDARAGHELWRYRAPCFEAALDEKRRLVSASGGRSGWARVYPLEV